MTPDHSPSGARPAIVFFFGGGWQGGTPTQFYPHCAYLASRGMVAISAEYRVSSVHGTTPYECVADAKSAMRWLRQHAVELGIDAERLAAGGGSAGGHLAAACALLKAFDEPGEDASLSCRPDALVLFNPAFENGPGGCGHQRVKDRWQEFSPFHNIAAGAPPTIVFLGSVDHVIPVATAAEYRRRMLAVGARCDVWIYEGQAHGFFNYRDGKNPYYGATLFEADRFLTSLGYLRFLQNSHGRHGGRPSSAEDRPFSSYFGGSGSVPTALRGVLQEPHLYGAPTFEPPAVKATITQ